MKKDNKISRTKRIDPERETRVLLEDVRREVKTVAEGHTIILHKLEEHDKKFTRIESELHTISTISMDTSRRVDALDVKVDALDVKVDALDVKVDALDVKVDALDVKFNTLDVKVNSIDTRLISVEDKLDRNLDDHKKRITKIEEKILT